MKSQDLIKDSKKVPKGRKINRDFCFCKEKKSKLIFKYENLPS